MSRPRDAAYEQAKAAWVAKHLAKAPALTEWQKQVITASFRTQTPQAPRKRGTAA